MAYFYLILSIVALTIGHYVKMLRWSKFVRIYEQPRKGNLLRSLSVGHILNNFIPYHIGDIFRVVLSGRKMKNGIGFSLATVIVEHYIDVLVVCAIFVGLHFIGFTLPMSTLILYAVILIAIIPLTIVLVKFNRGPKLLLKHFAGIFNERIEFKLLYFFWALISAFRDMYKRLSVWRVALWTIVMWCVYIFSYWCIAESLSLFSGDLYRLRDVFALMFSASSMRSIFAYDFGALMSMQNMVMYSLYLLLPLVIIFVVSYFFSDKQDASDEEPLQLLPQVNEKDRLNFLEAFFTNDGSLKYRAFLEMNKNIVILQDLSAGSNATTMLCMDKERTFYRKYSFGKDSEKLWDQVEWLQSLQDRIQVPTILNAIHREDLCCYDMPYVNSSVGFFQYIHSNPHQASWKLLRTIMDDLNANLYTSQTPVTETMMDAYIERKVKANLNRIYETALYKSLAQYDTLVINGVEYKNLPALASLFEPNHLKIVFKNEVVSPIHGDLTIENIVCVTANDKDGYYLIDPNTGNILDSKLLDYAKLMQSLHGGYEFMMKTKSVKMAGNKIDFPATRSSAYDYLYKELCTYITEHYGEQGLRVVYYHELVHWLRLMPYKIDNDPDRLPMFYAGLVMVMNELKNALD